MALNAAAESRLAALVKAKPNTWIALSADETRVVAEAETFEAVALKAERSGESDPLIMRVPDNWTARVL